MGAILVPTLDAGLGNQLFQVCSGWVCAKTHNCPLYITTAKKNKHNHKKHNYTYLLFRHLGIPLDIATGSTEQFEFVAKNSFRTSRSIGFHPWTPDEFQPGSIIDGYFQYYPPIAPYAVELRSILRSALTTALGECKRDVSTYAFLHIRRGDYLQASHVHPIVPVSYYERAIQYLPSDVRILVFCEDMDWYMSQSIFRAERFERVDSSDELECLQLMSECKVGAICANSTFSWWGAFLGAYGVGAPVVVPERWINDRVYSLIPDGWIRLT